MVVIASESVAASLTILLFGPMQVLVNGRPIQPLRSRKALWLLALLTLRPGRSVERAWLAGALWPDTDQSRAFTNLRVNLSELRRALGDQSERLQSSSRLYLSLNLTGADVDTAVFDAAIKSKTPEALKQAVALYRGPLLEDCTEEWIGQERNVREQEYLQALQTLADAALMAGDHVAASDYYRRAVNIDPWREAARRGWMEALAKSGDRNAAMQVYREFVELLRSDPRAVPDEETSALYVRLRSEARPRPHRPAAMTQAEPVDNEAASPVVRGYLPHSLTNLIGREEECIEVAARLRGSRLVTLTGSGGIGKTRLAIEVARETAEDGVAYPDGVWLVSLESLLEERLVVPQVASALGLREESGRTLLDILTDHLRSKRLLLVLDNCEHLMEACAQFSAHLLRECARIRILATSREAMKITGEAAWQVPSLAAPDLAYLPPEQEALLRVVAGYESVQLFIQRAQASQKSFVLTGNNALAVAQVCSQLEGIPLAIELAATRVIAMTIEQIGARLNDRFRFLTGGNRVAQSRQQTLRATLDWSYALLLEPERLLLQRLSVFVGGWSLEAAVQIGSENAAEGDVLDLMTGLVDKSLVRFESSEDRASGGRYRLLEMVRLYAAEKLQTSGEEYQAKAKHRDWFLGLAEQAALQLRGSKQRDWLQRLDSEYDNLRAALAWSAVNRQEAEAELKLAGALWRFWYIRGNYSEGRRYLASALDREDAQARTIARAMALNGAGALAYDQGDNVTARPLFEESLSISREWGDTLGVTSALGNLANVALAVGDIGLSRTLYEESLMLHRQLGNQFGLALQLSNLGIVLRQQGEYTAAKNCFEESLSISRTLDDRIGMARALLNMGNLAQNQNDFALERVCIEESLSIFRELGDKQGIARALGNLGTALNSAGELEAAQSVHEESLSIFQELGDSRGIALAFGHLGDIAVNLFDYSSASVLYRDQLSLSQKLKYQMGVAESLEGLAIVLLEQNEVGKAVKLWRVAESLRQPLGFPLPANKRAAYDQYVEHARSILGEAGFLAAWSDGSAFSSDEAIASLLVPEPENVST